MQATQIFLFTLPFPDFGSTAGSDPEDFESELLTEALQQSQWTGLDYCLHVTSGAVTFIINAIQAADKSDDALLLLNSVLNLLSLYDVKIAWDTATESRKVCVFMPFYSGYTTIKYVSSFSFAH